MKYWLNHLPLEVWVDVYRYPWISRRKLVRIVHKFRNRKYAEYLQFYLHDWGKQKLNNCLCLLSNNKRMKLALHYIPTEVWVDVFRYRWISRRKLGKIVDKFRNRKFAEFLQFFLHKWGKRILDNVYLDKDSIIPRTPMPENIRFFKEITILHFDSQTLQFLHRIGSLFLFNEVNLHLWGFGEHDPTMANVRTVLGHLLPLLHGIHSLTFNHIAFPLVLQHFGPKLVQVKLLSIDLRFGPTTLHTSINFCMNWLTDNTEPKFLEICIYTDTVQQFSMALQQQFDSAESECTFAIKLYCLGHDHNIADFLLTINQKNRLGEELHGLVDGNSHFLIYRHQPNAGTALKEWFEEALEKCYKLGSIDLYEGLTIGQIDADAGDIGVSDAAKNEEEEADQDQQTISKKQ